MEAEQEHRDGLGKAYADRGAMGRGPSTASQTAWGVMGLLAYRPPEDEAAATG